MCGGGQRRERQARGMLCKQPGFIISSQVTVTAGWWVFRKDRDTETPSSRTVEKQTGKES